MPANGFLRSCGENCRRIHDGDTMSNSNLSQHGRGAARARVATVVAPEKGGTARLVVMIGIVAVAMGAGIGAAFLSVEGPAAPNSRPAYASAKSAHDLGPVGETCSPPARQASGIGRGRDPLSQTEQMIMAEAIVTENFAEHVRCIVNNDRPRFCNRAGRAALASAVDGYLKRRRAAIRIVQQMGGAITTNPVHREAEATFQALAARPGVQRMAPAVPALDSLQDIDRGVVFDLQSLIREGYVTAGDFAGFLGLFMPQELAPHFEGIEVSGKACG